MEPEQGGEEVGQDRDEVEPESIINQVALFLAHLRSKSSMKFSNLNFMFQHMSSLIGDLVNSLHLKTMSLVHRFGLDQSPSLQELGVMFLESTEPLKGMETDYKHAIFCQIWKLCSTS